MSSFQYLGSHDVSPGSASRILTVVILLAGYVPAKIRQAYEEGCMAAWQPVARVDGT